MRLRDLISDFQVGRTDLRGGAVTRTEVGRAISEFYGRKVIGFDGSGRFAYEDVDGNGTIDDGDRTYIGSPHPTLRMVLTLMHRIKDLICRYFFRVSRKMYAYNYDKNILGFPHLL